jgi:hypothetical protein|tara:strand:- start:52 stop:1692 length:1641 start_codon:yes stop_codon:yes gene_type:complete
MRYVEFKKLVMEQAPHPQPNPPIQPPNQPVPMPGDQPPAINKPTQPTTPDNAPDKTVKVDQAVNKLVQLGKQDPKKSDKVSSTLDQIIKWGSKLLGIQAPKTEQVQPATLDQKGVEVQKIIDLICQKLPAQCDKPITNVETFIHNAFAEIHSQGRSAEKQDIKKLRAELGGKIKQLVAKAEGLTPETEGEQIRFNSTQKSIEAMLIAEVSKLRDDDTVEAQHINQFLDDSINGQIIDMTRLTAQKEGNIDDFINPKLNPESKEIYDKVRDTVIGFKPGGTTSGNYGPAEVGLAMFGNPANKEAKGDLQVGNVKYEIKGSGYKGKRKDGKGYTGAYGARIGAKDVNPGTSGWTEFDKQLKKIDKDLKGTNPKEDKGVSGREPGFLRYKHYTFNRKTKKGSYKEASRYNFNRRGIDRLNNEILGPKSNKEATTKMLQAVITKLIPNIKKYYPKGVNKKIEIGNVVGDDGTINIDNFNNTYGSLAYEVYQKGADQVGNIMFVNGSTRNYKIISNPAELEQELNNNSIKVSGGVTWNDDQQKATAQFFIE